MTRSNLHIILTNGKKITCVADSSSAPEQGYVVERLISPLLALSDATAELELLQEHCTMDERRCNACHRYSVETIRRNGQYTKLQCFRCLFKAGLVY